MAKALAGRGARTAARHCQQVLAGIGFTTEHRFHHYVRRVLVLDQLFGAGRSLTRGLGRELLATRSLPPLPAALRGRVLRPGTGGLPAGFRSTGPGRQQGPRVRMEDEISSSRLSPMGTTRTERSVTPASAKACSRFLIVDSLPATRMSPTVRASPCSSSFW